MDIVGEDGSIFKVKDDGFKAAFGRGSGFSTTDRTVSRRHVLFELNQTAPPRVSFQVVGKNPLWLRSGNGGRKIRTFRNMEKGEMEIGESFCISSQIPVWFNLKEIGEDWANADISQIDPVKEFGFLVIGHEFDCYPKNRIRDPKNWDWFLEESRKEEDGDSDKENKRKRRKRKKDEEDDDEWSDENEDIETTEEAKKGSRPKYMTRSKDKNKPPRSKERKNDSSRMKIDEEEEEDDDDEEDETLGGFIVNDEDEGEERGIDDEEEEEEEEELMEDEEDEE